MKKRWHKTGQLNEEQTLLKTRISSELKCPEIVAEILIRKGITDLNEIDSFFNPSIEDVHDPFLFKDMDKACNRIVEAIQNNEKITIYGDYDVDGTTSTALLYLGLQRINAIVDYYIPHRMIEGYGLSRGGVQQLLDSGTRLIISVDCGINAMDEVSVVNELGMQMIITDHHNPKDEIPDAFAIINPKMPDCKYPFKDLAGVGVAYKLLMAVYQKVGKYTESEIFRFLDLVAVGTIADIVPLIGENRIFAGIGLEHLYKKKNLGLSALISISGTSNKALNTTDIVFGLAPRINAAGRMGSAMRAVELLTSEDIKDSHELALIIEKENSVRQEIDQKTYREACRLIEDKYPNLDEVYCIVVASENWHPGVIGIVASKLVEKYYRPTIMIALNEGIGSGSGRSIADFNLFEALTEVEDMLESFGGHKYAAGLSVLVEYLDILEDKMNAYVKEHIQSYQLIPPLNVDHNIELYDIHNSLISWLEKFAPFGPGNMRPVFYTEKVIITNYPYVVGRNHLKMKVQKDGCYLDLIGFNMGHLQPLLKKNTRIDIAYSLEWNTWQNKITIQGKLKDIRFVKK